MLLYHYVARDPATGQKIKASIEAETEAGAAKILQAQGLAPIEISLSGGTSFSSNPITKLLGRITTKDKIIFSRQMSTLINAGLPLVQSLRSVNDQTTNKSFKVVISQIITDVEGGAAFSKALEKHPTVFNDIYINLVAAGEVSGTLDQALERIAFQQEKDAEIIAKVKGAMIYPAIVMLVMGGVLTFMVVKVLPQVEVIYDDIKGAELPVLTKVLLIFAHFVMDYWWAVIIALALMAFGVTKYARSGPGKEVVDTIKMRAWPAGPLFMKMYMARFARTGATLVSTGVPLIQMLEITGRSLSNVHIERSVNGAIEKVKGGKSLADSIEGDENFLPLVPNMLRIGEQSGSMEEMLDKTATYYEKEVDNQIKTVSTIIEPVLMVILGIVAFIIVAAVLLPIYGLAGKNLGG
jgi:type IV pilus assembly protein PilC